MFECKACGCDESIERMKGEHLGVYCKECDKWDSWKSQGNPKTSEEYRNEYLDKQPATDSQISYIKNLLNQKQPSKLVASKIIDMLNGEVE